MPNQSASNDSASDVNETSAQLMHVEVLLPSNVFARYELVEKITLDTPDGSFGLLPHRQDCVAAIEPGILSYTLQGKAQGFIALDEGVLVKNGLKVNISVRNAHADDSLAQLKQIVETEFVALDQRDKEARAVLARLESSFMRNFSSLKTS